MQSFEWALPTKIIFGLGKLASTHRYIRGFGKRALIVTSKSFTSGQPRAAILTMLTAQLDKLGVEYSTFGEIEPNPRTETIDRAAALVREFRPRFLIALGGGSVMDAAKCISLLAENDGGIFEYAYRGPGKPMRPFNHALPLVCIPTIAATSSETDFYAVVTDWETHRKVTVFGDAFYPKLSIIDPELTYSVPARQTVDGAFDIITHVMESYLSTKNHNPLQDRMTESIVETVTQALPRVLANPSHAEARAQLSWCASLALSGILSGRDGAWPIHALEHGLSAWTDIAHGRGLAMILPRIMDFNAPHIGDKLSEFNRRIFGKPGWPGLHARENAFVCYMKEVGAWTTWADIGIASHDAHSIAEKTVSHAMEISAVWKTGEDPYLDNIRPLKKEDALHIMNACKE